MLIYKLGLSPVKTWSKVLSWKQKQIDSDWQYNSISKPDTIMCTRKKHIFTLFHTMYKFIPREARAEGPSVARLINLSGRAGPSGAKPREFERKIYLYIYMCICLYL